MSVIIDLLRQKKLAVESDLQTAVELEEKLGGIRSQIVTAEKQLAALPKGKEALTKLGREIKLAQDKLSILDEQTQSGIAEQHRRIVSVAVCMVSNNLGAGDMYLRIHGWRGSNGTWFHENEAPDGLPIAAALRLRLIAESGPLIGEIERRLTVASSVEEARLLIADLLK